ncbi:hypothetical protein ACLOJK_018824 [Asimina triloba]
MEKGSSCVRNNGVLRLPPGFRFHPTDEELVVQYLKRKVFSCPLPASIIPDIDVCKFDPWELPGDPNKEKYFFCTRASKYQNGISRHNRASTGTGFWKATGAEKVIVAARSNQVVGLKKILVFYIGKPPKGSRTDWFMHEYRLPDVVSRACVFPQRKSSTQNFMIQSEDWVLCRVFLKRRSVRNEIEISEICDPAGLSSMPSASSSDSSTITDITATGAGGEENSSRDVVVHVQGELDLLQ